MDDYKLEQENTTLGQNGVEFFSETLSELFPFHACVDAHLHTAVEIIYVTSGMLQIHSDDRSCFAKAGETVLLRSNTIHWIYPAVRKSGTYYVLKITPSMIQDLSFPHLSVSKISAFSLSGKDNKIHWSAEESRDSGISAHFEQLIRESEQKEPGYDMAIKIHAASVLLAMIRSGHFSPVSSVNLSNENAYRRIYNVIYFINQHYSENLSAEQCSAIAYMSVSYFSRVFRQVAGKSFKEYLNTVRVNHADKILLTTDCPVSEVSSSCGFNSVSYFISTYKAIRGVTPLEFRKANTVEAL